MQQHVGTCSLCGGKVVGYRGAWHSILPPPPDTCTQCGAVRAEDVIEMQKPAYKQNIHYITGEDTSTYRKYNTTWPQGRSALSSQNCFYALSASSSW